MCGIAGVLGPSYFRPISLRGLQHRGPDERGTWTDDKEQIWLGHVRLSILDLSQAGHQPMECVGGRYIIVFNGEIYNFLELRKELEVVGYRFKSDSDTEVIPAAYDRWGIECLHRLNGMWAFSIWDCLRKEFWLSRDRFGEKPLYYYRRGDDFVFASEVKAIHGWLGRQAALDTGVIQSICSGQFEWHGTDRSYLNDVHSLPAGHLLWKGRNDWRVHRWYQLEPFRVQVPKSLPEQIEAFRELLGNACHLRLRSDVPLGTCLSGGVDSSSITAIIHKGWKSHGQRSAQNYHQAFCAGFSGTSLDETEKAQQLAGAVGADLKIHEITPPDAYKLLEAIGNYDGPAHSLAFYPIWELYGFIRKNGIKVTLDGQGPDEMMGGYFGTIQGALRGALRQGRLIRFWELYNTFKELGESPFQSSRKDARLNLLNVLGDPILTARRCVMAFFEPPQERGNGLEYALPLREDLPPLAAELYRQFSQNPLPTILQQYDRCSMAHGVECRMPFMDYRVVEFIFSLPEESLIGKRITKLILRESVKGLVPESIRLNKTKIGFNAPIVEWFLGPLREILLDTMKSADFLQTHLFDGLGVAKKFEEWLKAPNWRVAWGFWPSVHFILWQRQLKVDLNSAQK
jgi:asparagine synthase (glutamine-hydrolysing)